MASEHTALQLKMVVTPSSIQAVGRTTRNMYVCNCVCMSFCLSNGSGFDLSLSIFRAPLHLWSSWCYIYFFKFLLNSFRFSELSPVGLT